MNKHTFEIPFSIAPNLFFGVQNRNIESLKSCFPKLKLVARDNTITVFGSLSDIKSFEEAFTNILSHIHHYNSLDNSSLLNIISYSDITIKETIDSDIIVYGNSGKKIKAITENQKKIVESVKHNDIIFVIGSAGTGKTYTSVAIAVKALRDKSVKKIILTRPAVESGENLGFLPGDIKDKLDPYMQPLYDSLEDMIPLEKLKYYLENRIIQIAPLAFMRGRTLDDAFVILDEAQNTTPLQMKMFLTRMGKSAKFIITGDLEQTDLPKKVLSGLMDATTILKDIKGIDIIHLNNRDVLRHDIVRSIINAYRIKEQNNE